MKFISQFFKIFGTKVFSLLILFISRILTARLLGPSDLGSVGNAINFSTVISRLGSLGIAPTTQFTNSKHAEQRNTLLVYVVVASVAVGLLNLSILFYFENDILQWQFLLDRTGAMVYQRFIPWLPAIILSMTLPISLLGSGRIKAYSITQIVPLVIQTLFITILLYRPHSLDTIIQAQIIYWFSTITIALYFSEYKNFSFHFDFDLLKVFIKYAFRSWPQVILQFGIARFAVLIGSQYLTSQNLGYYLLASNLSESFLILNSSLTPIVFNQIASKGSDQLLLKKSIFISNFSTLLMFVTAVSIGHPIFTLAFGNEFEPSWNLFLLLFISILFQGMIRIFSSYLAGMGKNGLIAVIQLIQFSVLFFSSLVVCPLLGSVGLCYSAIAASILAFAFCLATFRNIEDDFVKIHTLLLPGKSEIEFLHKIYLSGIQKLRIRH